jgi:hypothetical protein
MINENILSVVTMHGKNLRKTQGFVVFFNENEDGSLSKKTLLYRDILRFYIAKDFELYVKPRELTKWLLNNNLEFFDSYSGPYENRTNISNRIENRLERVKACLDSMIDMDLLVHRQTKSSKGDSTTIEYALSGLGWLISLFIESLETPKRTEIYTKISEIFEKFFSDEPSSVDAFCLVYFKNLKEHGLFEEHIDSIKHFFFSSEVSYHDLLKYLLCFPLSSDKSGKERWKIWKQSLDQLPEFTKGLFLYQLKLYFDRIMERHVRSIQRYELERIAIASLEKLTQIVIELECKKCEIYYAASVGILAYLDAIYLNAELKFYKYESEKLVESQGCCEKCNTKLDFEKIII